MALSLLIENKKLLLEYYPEMEGLNNYIKVLKERGHRRIYNTFLVTMEDYYKTTEDDDVLLFLIGEEERGYIKVYKHIVSTEHDFYFDSNINLGKKDFVGLRKTSILQLLDKMVTTEESQIYIDEKEINDGNNHICYDDYRKFQRAIPHDTELTKYILMRAASVFRGVFIEADRLIEKHDKWINRIEKSISYNNAYNVNVADLDYLRALDYRKLIAVKDQLQYFIQNCDAYHESTFQKAISEVVKFVFPKYLYAVREVSFKGFDEHEKRPDFVMIDYNGMIDFMEIKKPSIKLINKTLYRNNYSPSHELSGAAQQIEKYIACIHRSAELWEQNPPQKVKECLPNTIELKVINPQGIIIMGEASDFDINQKKDFELIKRQYKHIAEIITYDDLLNRLNNMIIALTPYANNESERGR